MTPALYLLLALLPWPAQDEPARPPITPYFDVVRLVRDVDSKADRQHVHGVDDVLGLAGMLDKSLADAMAKQAAAPLQVTGAREFETEKAVEFRAGERIKIKLPMPKSPQVNEYWGVGIGTTSNVAVFGVTSPSYDVGGANQIKGLGRNAVFIYVPPGYRFTVVDGLTQAPILTGSGADGVTVDQITAKRYVGVKSLVPMRWTIPASALKAGAINVAGPEILPFSGTPVRVTAAIVAAPGTAGPAVGAGNLVIDVNVENLSLWSDQSKRPTLNAARPAAMFPAGLEVATLVAVAKEGSNITVDVDGVPASVQPGAVVNVTAWFMVEGKP